MSKKVCCVIVSYNIGKKLEKCFFSIKNQVDKVVIVDNGSDKCTVEYLEELKSNYDIELIKNRENMGIAYALNQGVDYTLNKNYEWILTMDNDSEASENMVSVMFDIYDRLGEREKKDIVSLFPKYIEKGTNDILDYESKIDTMDIEFIYKDITSGNLVKCDVFKQVGKFKNDFFIDSVDHEFCYRLVKYKYKLLKINNAILFHSLGDSKEKYFFGKKIVCTNHSALRKYYMTRNRFYLWKEYSDFKKLNRVDKIRFVHENIKIILFEKNKIDKLWMVYKGYKDYKSNILGKYIKNN